ncbi:hypothetical protein [Staphylococcus pseudoxylosus]|uniref:hypothetical protein n=1 Tax=Staphylococcus pseudoxylosus TaxID=2282419 RepID=UPI00299066E5|nr:hypothetical protein [Staphylococcus pseudoxylosus]
MEAFKDFMLSDNSFINQMALVNNSNDEPNVYVVPEYIIFIQLKITNLSHQSISITEFLINGAIIPEELYSTEKQNQIYLFTVFDWNDKGILERVYNGEEVPLGSSERINVDNTKNLKPIIKLDAKEVKIGVLSFRLLGEKNYNLIENGNNLLTIKTTDKEFDELIEIQKTLSKTEISNMS